MATETRHAMDLGERVAFSAVLKRTWVPSDPPYRGGELRWLPVEQQGEGVLVGYRTLSHGWTDYDPEDGNTWRQTGHIRCALVAVSLYRNPTPVPLDALLSLSSPEVTP